MKKHMDKIGRTEKRTEKNGLPGTNGGGREGGAEGRTTDKSSVRGNRGQWQISAEFRGNWRTRKTLLIEGC